MEARQPPTSRPQGATARPPRRRHAAARARRHRGPQRRGRRGLHRASRSVGVHDHAGNDDDGHRLHRCRDDSLQCSRDNSLDRRDGHGRLHRGDHHGRPRQDGHHHRGHRGARSDLLSDDDQGELSAMRSETHAGAAPEDGVRDDPDPAPSGRAAPRRRLASSACPTASHGRRPVGAARPHRRCWPPPPVSTCGGSARPAGPTPSTRPPSRPGRRAGRRSSSARSTRPTSSPSTSRRPPCGSWSCRRGSSASTRGASSCRRRSRASPPSACSTPRCGAGSAPAAGLLAGAVLAVTPVAALMFRFNNPDALLVAAPRRPRPTPWSAPSRAASTRWLVAAGTLVGFGFLTKMLQAFLVVPAFALVYLVAGAAPPRPAPLASSRSPAVALVVSGAVVGGRRDG